MRNLPGFVSRALAFIVDIFAMAAFCVIATQAITLTGQFFRIGSFALGRRLMEFAVRAAVVIVIATYLPACWALTGRSIGKALYGLRIVQADGSPMTFARALVRFGAYWLSALPFGLGFLTVIFDPRRRSLHDRLAGTLVVFDERSREATQQRSLQRRGPASPLRP
jgi:uncharacterized RDD family membrane protein YckC